MLSLRFAHAYHDVIHAVALPFVRLFLPPPPRVGISALPRNLNTKGPSEGKYGYILALELAALPTHYVHYIAFSWCFLG